MNNIKDFKKFNEGILDSILPKKSITKEDIEATGDVDKETMDHKDYSSTIRFALSNLESRPNQLGDREYTISILTIWINGITKEYTHINNGTMTSEFNRLVSGEEK
jgi:hypothetical protein